MEEDVRFFWDVFIKAHEEWVMGIQKRITPILEEFLRPIIKEAGLDPNDFKIVWRRPELEYYHSSKEKVKNNVS